jgi:hypothetical protein
LRAVLYSGFCSKREEFSRVETSSVGKKMLDGCHYVDSIRMYGYGGVDNGRTFVGLLELGLGGKVRHVCVVCEYGIGYNWV